MFSTGKGRTGKGKRPPLEDEEESLRQTREGNLWRISVSAAALHAELSRGELRPARQRRIHRRLAEGHSMRTGGDDPPPDLLVEAREQTRIGGERNVP